MRVLVLGGIRSGKSDWAEAAITAAAGPGRPVRYVATGPAASDADWTARVHAHRQRRPGHWTTVETQDLASELGTDAGIATLVDDVGGWLTAAMDRRGVWSDTRGSGEALAADVEALLATVELFSHPLALVSPEVGLTVVPATRSGRRFVDELGALNRRLATLCDQVVLVVAGQPLTLKAQQ